MSADPDALGTDLWQQNHAATTDPAWGDPPLPAYHFQALPFGVTAVEGLKACAHYRYQTADDEEAWQEGPAPWGWVPADIAARMGRGGAPVTEAGVPADEPPVDPLLAQVETAFQAAGLTLNLPFRDPPPLTLDLDPRLRTARREIRFPTWQPYPILSVEIYADNATARRAWRSVRGQLQDRPLFFDLRLARIGRVVVSYERMSQTAFPSDLTVGLTALGEPDEMWTNADPPILISEGDISARRVPLTAGHHTGGAQTRIVVARDEASRQALIELVGDDTVRAQVAAVDLSRHSVLLLIGIAAIDEVEQVTPHECVGGFENDVRHELRLATTGSTRQTATVVTVDRLPLTPSTALLVNPIEPWRMPAADQ
ncbi:hypothetical protein DFJ67_6939 [Asanoa ferruginea]|uniref:Uncharacterized protein n=1 Tax=Asanoa ferruginea TaxID=53367 RepID=A0A3D9ZUJ4_9ACTN|nr:hypothetical protein [Asanoa ferruginea]REG00882.1 hypothetical protein DFJ67_6939 [Asanoa ferruginea]GIF47458.1 hypothetical protein Afe04nite_19970 [Asanoa ferruginea]